MMSKGRRGGIRDGSSASKYFWRGKLKSRVLAAAAAIIAVVGVVASPASAQTEAEFIAAFAGEWQVYDETLAEGGERCRLNLQTQAQNGAYQLENSACGAELAEVSQWRILNSQMTLLDDSGVVVSLGGNQRRMTGTAQTGTPIILERIGGETEARALQALRQARGCYYLGFTAQCATDTELQKPVAAAENGEIRINVRVNLNVRAEARNDATVIGILPADTCIVADTCTTASDGVWCRAAFGDQTGWVRKTVIRQERWPVVTFLNECPSPAS